jgi:hypothetical protein
MFEINSEKCSRRGRSSDLDRRTDRTRHGHVPWSGVSHGHVVVYQLVSSARTSLFPFGIRVDSGRWLKKGSRVGRALGPKLPLVFEVTNGWDEAFESRENLLDGVVVLERGLEMFATFVGIHVSHNAIKPFNFDSATFENIF